MNHFADRLTDAVRTYKNPTVMGLDPIVTYIPDSLKENAAYLTDDPEQATGLAIIQFNERLIDATADIIPVVKLQLSAIDLQIIRNSQAIFRLQPGNFVG